jgi:CBS domain-containing protein
VFVPLSTNAEKEDPMPHLQDILAVKGPHVYLVSPKASVLDAALLMNEHKIGSLVVCEGKQVRGIFTERDILTRVVAQQRDPVQTPVYDVMSTEVACATPHTTIDEARGVMKNRRLRHLPVVNEDGELCGLISIGDLNAHDNNSKEQTIHFLEMYISGEATL